MVKTASTEKEDENKEEDGKEGEYQTIEIPKLHENEYYEPFQTKPLSGEERVDRWGSRYLGWSTKKTPRRNYRRLFYSMIWLIGIIAVLSFILVVYDRMQRSTGANRLQTHILATKLEFFRQKLKDLNSLLSGTKDKKEGEPVQRNRNGIKESSTVNSVVRRIHYTEDPSCSKIIYCVFFQ